MLLQLGRIARGGVPGPRKCPLFGFVPWVNGANQIPENILILNKSIDSSALDEKYTKLFDSALNKRKVSM
jgi:hypothetical protein